MGTSDAPPMEGGDPTNEKPEEELQPNLELEEFAADAAAEEPPLLPMREPMRGIFKALGMIEQVVGGLFLLLILILVLGQVAQRYVHGTWPWTGELARYSLVWATFLMAGYLIAYAPHHIAIHVIDYVAKGRWLDAVKLFVNVVVLLTTVAMIYGSYTLIADDIGQVTAAGQIPLRYVNMVPLVGLILIVLRVILGIVVRDVPALLGRDANIEEDAA